MKTINWNNPPNVLVASNTMNDKWFGIAMGLIGIIIGFSLNHFVVPQTLGAEILSPPAANQEIVVQPSPIPIAPPTGGGCGMGGSGGCGCGAAALPR